MCFSSQNNPETCLEHLCGIKNGARRLSSKRSKSRKFPPPHRLHPKHPTLALSCLLGTSSRTFLSSASTMESKPRPTSETHEMPTLLQADIHQNHIQIGRLHLLCSWHLLYMLVRRSSLSLGSIRWNLSCLRFIDSRKEEYGFINIITPSSPISRLPQLSPFFSVTAAASFLSVSEN